MAYASLLLANNDARQNVVSAFIPPDLSAREASQIHSCNGWVNLAAWAFLQFSNIFYCHPISKVWGKSAHVQTECKTYTDFVDWAREYPGHCWNINQLLLAGGGVTVTLDIIIIVLPVRAILGLRITSKMRLGVMCIFVIGIL
jgi:hypothetical protein